MNGFGPDPPPPCRTFAQTKLRPGFAYTPVASVSHVNPWPGLGPPAPIRGALDFTGTNIQKKWPFASGRKPNWRPPWWYGEMLGWVGQIGPLAPRKFQVWPVTSFQGVFSLCSRGSSQQRICRLESTSVFGGRISVVTTDDTPEPHGFPGMATRNAVQ